MNGKKLPVLKYSSNSLSSEACRRFGLDCVEMDIVYTDLGNLGSQLITYRTYGLICYAAKPLDLGRPVVAKLGARLVDLQSAVSDTKILMGTHVEVFDHKGFKDEGGFSFTLHGEIGCTAAINLGFLVLKTFHGISTKKLGILFLFDVDRSADVIKHDLHVDDGPILKLCREHHLVTIDIEDDKGDCNEYPECKN